MRKVVAAEYLTLDGVTEDPGPSGDFAKRGWTIPYWNDELSKSQSDLLFASDALLLGRVTYEEFAAAWPSRSGDPFTDRMNSLPKFVASKTLKGPLKWNATLLKGDVADEVAKLKKQSGQTLLIYGSGALVNTLMQRNLIDSYQLMIYPIVLGSGERFFRAGLDTTLSLSDAKTTAAGVAVLTYHGQRTIDDRQAHAVALGRHTLVWSSRVAGGARRVRHPAERAAPRAGAGLPRADSVLRIGLGGVLPLARSGGLRPTCVLDRPERLEIHWSGIPDGVRGGDVAGRFRLAGRARRYCDGGYRTLGRCARRGGRRIPLEQGVPRLESLWDRRLRGRRPPRHAKRF